VLQALVDAYEHYDVGCVYPNGCVDPSCNTQERDFPVSGMGQEWMSEPPGRVLDIGCRESWVPEILVDADYDVVGIDMRELDRKKDEHDFLFIQGDFTTIKHDALQPYSFDIITATSSIEHFGLGAYGETVREDGDIRAVVRAGNLLKLGGLFYLTVPTGTHLVTDHFRRYTEEALHGRLLKYFSIVKMVPYERYGKKYEKDPFKVTHGADVEMVAVLRRLQETV